MGPCPAFLFNLDGLVRDCDLQGYKSSICLHLFILLRGDILGQQLLVGIQKALDRRLFNGYCAVSQPGVVSGLQPVFQGTAAFIVFWRIVRIVGTIPIKPYQVQSHLILELG